MPPKDLPPILDEDGELISTAPKPREIGPVIGTLLIVILLIFGALYFYGAALNKEDVQNTSLIPSATPTLQ